MDVESYDRWRSALALLKIIAQGEADVAAGRLVSQEEAFARASRALDRPPPKTP
jgi:predicted transcriptional regulator